MTDLEELPIDCVVEGMSNLETMCTIAGLEYTRMAYDSKNPFAHYLFIVATVKGDYRNERHARSNMVDFLFDRYTFWSNFGALYSEKGVLFSKEDALMESFNDSFEYLVRLRNDWPLYGPPMGFDWRDHHVRPKEMLSKKILDRNK